MGPSEKFLPAIAGVQLTISVVAMTSWPAVCLTSAACALALSLYLRHRGAFRNGNAPLAGAFLVGGSAIMTVLGIGSVNMRAALVLLVGFLVAVGLFLLVFARRLRGYGRRIELESEDDFEPPT